MYIIILLSFEPIRDANDSTTKVVDTFEGRCYAPSCSGHETNISSPGNKKKMNDKIESFSDLARECSKEFAKKHKHVDLGGKFEQLIKPAIRQKIASAFMLGRNYTNLSTSHEPEILNHQTKDAIVEFLKKEGFKIALRDRWPGSKHLRLTILISWK